MQTFSENVAYLVERYLLPKRSIIAHFTKVAILLVSIALLLETFVFNANHFISASYDTIDLERKIELSQNSDDIFLLTEVNHELEFNNLNTDVKNVGIFFSTSQPAQVVPIKIQFTDEAHQTYFDSTEYTVGIPDTDISTASRQSQYINLNSTGLMNSLKISVVGEDVSYPLYLDTIQINAVRPFDFKTCRFLAALAILTLLYVFRPKSAIYKMKVREHPKASKTAVIFTVVIECILAASFTFFGSNLVGVATSFYNQGDWDGTSLVNTFEVGGDNAQQYAELAKSMANGHLYLDEEPPDWLKEMDSPYDRGARDELQKETGQDYLFDVAYYDGKYYVYFGVVPVMIFYLPFYLLTGDNFPTAIGVLIAVMAFIAGCSALLDRFARYHFKKVSLGLYLIMQIALISGCGVLYLLKFPTFYSLPLACGLAFSVWGLYFWMHGRIQPKRRWPSFLAGSFCMALVVGCRPQLVMLSCLAFPLFWRPYITERRIITKKGALEFACLILPYIIVVIGIMGYNNARFGSPLDFGANYNLTVNDMTQRGWILGRFAPAFFAYFLQFPNVDGVFPFLQSVNFATTYMGQTIKEATFGGIFACYPILWLLVFTAPIVSMRNEQRDTKTITGEILVLVVSGIVIALVDAQMAGILQRYYADFSFMFFAAIVLLVFIINENLLDTSYARYKNVSVLNIFKCGIKQYVSDVASRRDFKRRQRAEERNIEGVFTKSFALKALLLLVSAGVLYATLLCFVPETGWYSDIYPWAYDDIIRTIQFWR